MPVALTRPPAASTVRTAVRRAGILLAAGVAVIGLGACTPDGQLDESTRQDMYRLGCPALDAAVTGSGVAKDVTVQGLRTIRDSGQLDAQPQQWLDSAISALDASSPRTCPPTPARPWSPAAPTTATPCRTSPERDICPEPVEGHSRSAPRAALRQAQRAYPP